MYNAKFLTMNDAEDWHVVGLYIQANPQKMASIKATLLSIPHTEIPTEDDVQGKLVVVMQSHDEHILLDNMEAIKDIDGVITVLLVYHQQDEHSK